MKKIFKALRIVKNFTIRCTVRATKTLVKTVETYVRIAACGAKAVLTIASLFVLKNVVLSS